MLTYSQQSRGNHTYPVLSEGGVVAEETVGKTKKPFYKKWWFWGMVGAAVVGAVVPTVLLTRPKSHKAETPNVIELP